MKKPWSEIILSGLILPGMMLACNLLASSEQEASTLTPAEPSASPIPTQTLTPLATNLPPRITETNTPFNIATKTPVQVPYATPEPAPFCEEVEAINQTSCQYPIVEQTSAFCVKKSPYALVALSNSATFEVLHEYAQCEEAGIINGQRNIICTAPFAYYFELQVCDSACSSLQIEQDLDRCPFGYVYNNLQNCCTRPVQDVSGGCTVLKLKTISCAIDCAQYVTASECADYGYSCIWKNETKTCQLKK